VPLDTDRGAALFVANLIHNNVSRFPNPYTWKPSVSKCIKEDEDMHERRDVKSGSGHRDEKRPRYTTPLKKPACNVFSERGCCRHVLSLVGYNCAITLIGVTFFTYQYHTTYFSYVPPLAPHFTLLPRLYMWIKWAR
jgi:hypothetical protein